MNKNDLQTCSVFNDNIRLFSIDFNRHLKSNKCFSGPAGILLSQRGVAIGLMERQQVM